MKGAEYRAVTQAELNRELESGQSDEEMNPKRDGQNKVKYSYS